MFFMVEHKIMGKWGPFYQQKWMKLCSNGDKRPQGTNLLSKLTLNGNLYCKHQSGNTFKNFSKIKKSL